MSARHEWSAAGFRRFCLVVVLTTAIPAASLNARETIAPAVPRRGGTLHFPLELDLRTLDPAQVYTFQEGIVACLVFNSLYDYDNDSKIVPELAESLPTISPDHLTYEIRLREGIRFANGRIMTADDVVYSIERYLDPAAASAYSSYYGSLKGAKAFANARRQELESSANRPPGATGRWLEPTHLPGVRALSPKLIRIQLERPDLAFPHVLASVISSIVPREEVERLGSSFGVNPVGAGPFVLRRWVRGIRMDFERNPHFFKPGQPYLDRIEVPIGIDFSTQAMMIETGEADVIWMITDPDYVRLRDHSRLAHFIESARGASPLFVYLNCELPPFTNRLVRAALNHAVDKQAVLRALLNRGIVARGPLPTGVEGFNPELPEYRYDPDRARALLAEAGLPDGFSTTLWAARELNSQLNAAFVVQQNLRAVGVDVEIKEVSNAAIIDAGQRRRTVPMGMGYWAATFNDPKDTLDTLFNGDNITDTGCLNTAFYSNADVQGLFRAASVESDPNRRIQLYQLIERKVVEDGPWIFLAHINLEAIHQPWVKGIRQRPFWPNTRLEGCWIER